MADRVSDAPTIFVAWQDFLVWLLPTTAKLLKHVGFTFVNRIDNLALDIAEDLVEARYSRSKAPVLARANLRLEKLRPGLQHTRLPPARCLRARVAPGQCRRGDARRMAQAAGRTVRRLGHLFESVANFNALRAAERRARRGKRSRPDVARFVFHLEANLLALESELCTKTYTMRPYRTFFVREPKLRRI